MGLPFPCFFGRRKPNIHPSLSRAEVKEIRRLVPSLPGIDSEISSIQPATEEDIPPEHPEASPANAYLVTTGRIHAPLVGRGMSLLAVRTDDGFAVHSLGLWLS